MEQQAATKICLKAGMTPSDTWDFISIAENHQKGSLLLVFKWHNCFANGRTDCVDDKRTGRPSITMGFAVFPRLTAKMRVTISGT